MKLPNPFGGFAYWLEWPDARASNADRPQASTDPAPLKPTVSQPTASTARLSTSHAEEPMKQTLEVLKLLAGLIPTIVALVKAIEEALPEKGQGAEKLAYVRTMIEQAYAAAKDAAVPFAELWPHIERTVAFLVGVYNRTGAWRK